MGGVAGGGSARGVYAAGGGERRGAEGGCGVPRLPVGFAPTGKEDRRARPDATPPKEARRAAPRPRCQGGPVAAASPSPRLRLPRLCQSPRPWSSTKGLGCVAVAAGRLLSAPAPHLAGSRLAPGGRAQTPAPAGVEGAGRTYIRPAGVAWSPPPRPLPVNARPSPRAGFSLATGTGRDPVSLHAFDGPLFLGDSVVTAAAARTLVSSS